MRKIYSLQEVVKSWMQKSGKETLFQELRIKEEWILLLGEKINAKTDSIHWMAKDHIILIKISDPLLRNELNYAKESIIEKLNDRIEDIEIQKILIM